jgi:hypothetical protein
VSGSSPKLGWASSATRTDCSGDGVVAPSGEGMWARVEKDAEFQVIVFADADMVEVTAIPGLGGRRSYGYVARAAVTPTGSDEGR